MAPLYLERHDESIWMYVCMNQMTCTMLMLMLLRLRLLMLVWSERRCRGRCQDEQRITYYIMLVVGRMVAHMKKPLCINRVRLKACAWPGARRCWNDKSVYTRAYTAHRFGSIIICSPWLWLHSMSSLFLQSIYSINAMNMCIALCCYARENSNTANIVCAKSYMRNANEKSNWKISPEYNMRHLS